MDKKLKMIRESIDWKQLCIDAKLEMPDSFRNASPDEVRKVYNGAGSDWLPAWDVRF